MDNGLERIGVITDAHANLPATQAALDALDAAGCDLIIHTGDAIGIGPHPCEVLDMLFARPNIIFLMGNHDELFAFDLLKSPPSHLGSGEIEHQRWIHSQLREQHRNQMSQWSYSHDTTMCGATLRFEHYARTAGGFSPIVRDNDPGELDRLFQPTSDIVFFGHHHPRCDVQGNARYINPGALGTNPANGARYALVTKRNDITEISFHAVGYDASAVRNDLINKQVPEANFILDVFMKG